MIKKNFLLAFGLAALLLLSGCFQPFKQSEASISYSISKDGTITQKTILTGTTGEDFNNWLADCKKEIKDSINQVISNYQNAAASPNLSSEQKTGYLSAINVLTNLKNRIECKAVQTPNPSVEYSFSLSFAELEQLAKLPNLTNPLIVSKNNELLDYTIPVIEEQLEPYTGMNVAVKEVRISVDGRIDSIEPTGFSQEGNEFVLQSAGKQTWVNKA